MKKRIMILIAIIISLLFVSGITFSKFNSDASLVSKDQKVASFVFKDKNVNSINLPLEDLLPGQTKEYSFSVSNNNENSKSDVTLEYQININTYHFLPLNINLYKIENNEEKLVLTCDETYSRNEQNKIVCNSSIYEMDYRTTINNDYKLKIEFPMEYNDESYSNISDYIDMEIKSWQK